MLVSPADRHKISPAGIFDFCATTITAVGGNIKAMSLSLSTVLRLNKKAEVENATAIETNFVFRQHLVVHYGKKRKQRGEWKDFLAVCVTGSGMQREDFGRSFL